MNDETRADYRARAENLFCRGITGSGVAYRRYGEGEPLFLTHGGAGSWTHWIRNIEKLGTCFQVFALDLPGYGDSRRVKPDIPIDDYITLVSQAVGELSHPSFQIRISGFSFGSFIAGGVASQLSDRMHSLSLIGISGFERPVGRNVDLVSIRRLKETLGREPTVDEVREMHRHNLMELMLLHENSIDDDVIGIQSQNVKLTNFDSRRLSWSGLMPVFLTEITCPIYLIFGDNDRSVYPSIDRRICDCISIRADIESTVIRSCGHWAQFEEADRVNQILLDFHA